MLNTKQVCAAVVACLLLVGCGASGQGGPARNSIAAIRATSEAATLPTVAPATLPVATAAADAPQVAPTPQAFNQVELGLDSLVVTLAVIFGIPAFWMVTLGAIRRKKRTA